MAVSSRWVTGSRAGTGWVRRRADLNRVEVEDLQTALPGPLRERLERGKTHVGGQARRMSLDEFVDRVAHKEDISFDAAFEHIRAVLATLAEALPPRELRDVARRSSGGRRGRFP